MSRPQNLYRLQQIDSQIDQADLRLKEIRTLLSDNTELNKASGIAAKADKILQSAKKELRTAEQNVKNQQIKIEQVENSLYSGVVRNPKELQDLQNEATSLKRFLVILEDRQLEAMLSVDEANEIFSNADAELQKIEAQNEKQQKNLVDERDKILGERELFLAQQKDARKYIIPTDLNVYERLRKQRTGIAVAKVENRACNACGSTLSAALNQSARSPSQVVFCESCGRILFAT
jgi:predicted  nucleic acid-binding Zn-ribbon protein